MKREGETEVLEILSAADFMASGGELRSARRLLKAAIWAATKCNLPEKFYRKALTETAKHIQEVQSYHDEMVGVK